MNYASLCTNVQDITENTFTADQLAMFTQVSGNPDRFPVRLFFGGLSDQW